MTMSNIHQLNPNCILDITWNNAIYIIYLKRNNCEKMYISPKETCLPPLLKYPGGKEKELIYILPRLPLIAENYYEPFVGGGAVFFSLDAQNYFLNDKSYELIRLYALIKENNKDFFDKIIQINHNWKVIEQVVTNHYDKILKIYYLYNKGCIDKQKLHDEISSFVLHNTDEFNGLISPEFNVGIQNFINELIKAFKNKIIRMSDLEIKKGCLTEKDLISNIECAFKSAFYTHFRYLYNNAKELCLNEPFYIAIYFYIREFCYSSMFRYNSSGKFNVPYGGISYNNKSLDKKIKYFQSSMICTHLQKTVLSCEDFESFLNIYTPSINDFMFLDPPYDTDFSTYAKNTFDKKDQERLALYLKNDCDCYFMMIIKNTEFIQSLYKDGETVKNNRKINITRFDKKYFVSFQNRNDKKAEHLIITNY